MFIPLYIAALALAAAGTIYDVVLTERGIKAGVGVEANDSNPKPSAKHLYLKNFAWLVGVSIPAGLVALVNTPAALGLLVAPVVGGVKHYLGGREWQRLLDGGKPADPNAPQTAWQKFWQG